MYACRNFSSIMCISLKLMKYWSIFVLSAIPVQFNTQVTGIRWNPPGQYAVNIHEVSLIDNISLCLVIM